MATALVVDDERTDLELTAHVLRRKGHTVLGASNYFQAIDIFLDHLESIDLLVADVAIADKNGCELAKDLLDIKPDLAVLFISGFVGSEVCKQYGVEVGALHFLSKPFLSDALADRVDEILRSPRKSPFSAGSKIRTANESPI
ncbi:MAG TPA: response regulator [Blastocatellia bacterium]|jgi:DNA-binding response OmpR family regulator|nr:response regulator [Blastocatellia bacterium]